MPENVCRYCDHDENAPDGICNKTSGSDGKIVRCVGSWSKDKLFYLQKYLEIFTTSMRPKWKSLCYIDVFAGPGKCKIRKSGKEILGSPLIALSTKYPFDKYIFIDDNSETTSALTARTKEACEVRGIDFNNVVIETGDCNQLVATIKSIIPKKSLTVCFLDPTGLQLKYESIRQLTEGIPIDLVINFPLGTALKRNIDLFHQKGSLIMNNFWGNEAWRKIYEELPQGASDRKFEGAFIKGFWERLSQLGYKPLEIDDVIGIRHYYFLLFASKHPLGQKFGKEVAAKEPSGQGRLEL